MYLSISPRKWWPFSLGLNVLNTLMPRQNGRHFTDDHFKCIFLNENIWNSINTLLKFIPMGRINNIPKYFWKCRLWNYDHYFRPQYVNEIIYMIVIAWRTSNTNFATTGGRFVVWPHYISCQSLCKQLWSLFAVKLTQRNIWWQNRTYVHCLYWKIIFFCVQPHLKVLWRV